MGKISVLLVIFLMSLSSAFATNSGLNGDNVFFPLASTALGGLSIATAKEGAPGVYIGAGLIGSGAVLSLVLHIFGGSNTEHASEYKRMRTDLLALERTGEMSATLSDYLNRIRVEVPAVTELSDKELAQSLVMAQAVSVSGISVK